ncbi:MAG: hypothetical protein ACJAWV_004425 [Flammeovirgaceae bacterium]|jgi:hypothetical protein
MISFSKKRKAKAFKNHVIAWKSEMILYMMSDGYKDQIGGERRRGFGKLQLIEKIKIAQ